MQREYFKILRLAFLFTFLVALLPVRLLSQNTQRTLSDSTDELSLQVIVLRTPEEARDVLERLKKGESFERLAREKSIDPTAESGGFMGKFSPGALREELRDALKGVGPGQFSPVVHIPSGYAILKVMLGDDGAAPKEADRSRSFALSAAGTVKYIMGVGGIAEAQTALLGFPKEPGWNADPHKVCEFRKRSLANAINSLSDKLASEREVASTDSPMNIMQTHYALAQLYAYLGNMQPAVEQFEASYRIALASVPQAVLQMEETLGAIHLHKAEMENGAYRTPGRKCLLPISPQEAYRKTEDSEIAISYFQKYLAKKPDDLEVKWLLNIAYMTIGKYPARVPPKFLIPPTTFESKEDVGRFVDVALETGLNSFDTSGGVIVDDFENNGLLDVVTSGWESCEPMHYFHNNGDGTFTDQTTRSGLSDQIGSLNIIQTDYNNDGCLDILVLRGAWQFPQRMSLMRNNCDGTFTDVTIQAGLGEPIKTQNAVWVDINNDGLLDLFVGNESGTAKLFLNKGDGTFEDIGILAGVSGDGTAYTKGVAAADYDNDGYMDLYVSNLSGDNFLYHNNHDNTFTEVTAKAGVPGSGRGFATWFFDYDNDGFADLFATSYTPALEETVRTYLGLPHNAPTLKLYKNMRNGTFRDVTKEAGLDRVYMPMGANFGDLDNDGYLDIYLGNGSPSYVALARSVLLRNHDGKFFVDITSSSGMGELHKGHGIAFADLFNAGNEDVVAGMGGATPGDAHALRVFRNPGHGNDWITAKLVGVKSNRPGIGARIKVTVENEGRTTRSIYRTVGSGGSFGASPLQQHIGLGKSARIVSLEVDWPASKTRQVFRDVDKNQSVEIKEFGHGIRKLDRQSTRSHISEHSDPGRRHPMAGEPAT